MSFLTSAFFLILLIVLVIVISSLPLYVAVKILGGKASILKVFLTNMLIALISALGINYFGIGSLVILIITFVLYSFIFEIGLFRAFLAWLIQYVVAVILVVLAILFFGLNLALIA